MNSDPSTRVVRRTGRWVVGTAVTSTLFLGVILAALLLTGPGLAPRWLALPIAVLILILALTELGGWVFGREALRQSRYHPVPMIASMVVMGAGLILLSRDPENTTIVWVTIVGFLGYFVSRGLQARAEHRAGQTG